MIGYYAHHQGTGHMRTALQVIPFISEPVILLSSVPKPDNLPANVTYIELIDDSVAGYEQPDDSLFMYTPQSEYVLSRYQQILAAIKEYDITTMYVDVSMEVALFCKTLGLTVGHNVLLGNRDDARHTLLFDACDYYVSDNDPRLDGLSKRHGPKEVQYVGGISRYKKAELQATQTVKNIVITLSPKSERTTMEHFAATAQSYPDITWHIVGPADEEFSEPNIVMHGTVGNPYELYQHADVIVGAGGHNTIMEAASLGKRFVCIPEDRPYEEQVVAAKALAENAMAVYRPSLPVAHEWDAVFTELEGVDVRSFQSLVDDAAAQKLAHVIAAHA